MKKSKESGKNRTNEKPGMVLSKWLALHDAAEELGLEVEIWPLDKMNKTTRFTLQNNCRLFPTFLLQCDANCHFCSQR